MAGAMAAEEAGFAPVAAPAADLARDPAPVPEADAPPLRLTVPLLLAAGWGALLCFSLGCLMEDSRGTARERAASAEPASEGADPAPHRQEPGRIVPAARAASADDAPPGLVGTANAASEASPAVVPAVLSSASPSSSPFLSPAAKPQGERPDYVGTWGPHALACGAHSRRRGYIPATITEDGAKAGRTLCRFRNGRRDGIAWTVAADCSERGRRWTSQVRLLVDGDRLTWTSGKGPAFYVRCGRRDG